ncbi:MAG TPA: flagellar biosynthetic protein FliR [Fimbriimonadaceae bacterium]|nr:flagellar biosynthetic protein FliR [Fimbriimonadaceae bacterium]
MSEALMFSFLCVFVRCSAMFLSSPLFGSQGTPVGIRVMTCMAISGALTFALPRELGAPPADVYNFIMTIAHEVVAGLLIGAFMSLVLQAAQMAGALIDTQMGLGMSQTLNPINGVSSTVISQFKYFLAVVIFLSIDGHHVMLKAFVDSYSTGSGLSMDQLPALKNGFVGLVEQLCLLGLQMAAPVLGVSLVVDAALGVINKAVPQMQVIQVGMPAKIVVGMIALGVGLPALVSGVNTGVEASLLAVSRALHGG